MVRGYFRYQAVPRNEDRWKAFRHEVLRLWWWQLRRRSERSRWSWERFQERLGHLIPEVDIQHPYPEVRFASHNAEHFSPASRRDTAAGEHETRSPRRWAKMLCIM